MRVQMAGVSVVAIGGTSPAQLATRGMYGWSETYQDVLELREKYNAALARAEKAEGSLSAAEEQLAAVTQERDECKAAMIRDRLEYVSTYEKALPVFEHVDPKLQECPDCHAEVGAPCAFHGDYTGPRGPSYVHINRCFTPGSRASIEAHYRGKKA